MCGIFFSAASALSAPDDISLLKVGVLKSLQCRGPDCSNTIHIQRNANQELIFHSTVLSMRDPMTSQPLVKQSDILQFNGELYSFTGDLAGLDFELSHGNDTFVLLDSFLRVGVLSTIKHVRGEYAFVFYDSSTGCVWFGRDCIGRRSLLINKSHRDGIAISSIPPQVPGLREHWEEVPAGEIYKLNLSNFEIKTIPWSYHATETELVYYYPPVSDIVSFHSQAEYDSLIAEVENKLCSAIKIRLFSVHQTSKPTYAILFSGGIDCTLLAYFINTVFHDHSSTVTIDLLNVAFENPRTGKMWETPDRILGRRSWKELVSSPSYANSACKFTFIEINVPFSEVQKYKSIVSNLMFPQSSVMDYSIALAFFFASRGSGALFTDPLSTDPENAHYTTSSKILFSGLGADELFAGYTRHSTNFKRDGYTGLVEELDLDFSRLHSRNLGRDDRVASDSGREVRYPYLDEDVVKVASNACLDSKIRIVDGQIECKWVLRQIATRIGLHCVAKEKKRAIQFGARSAKLEPGQGKIKGTDKFL
ncbi:asparagine synthase-domain-containing protein [Lipomyces japonicus]|uniref:asparagine synthase-domain-containing protein n=1 Tax=Lipomyces japonicus TaxID=56871 RepID=UPI0034CE3847